MRIVRRPKQLARLIRQMKSRGERIGFVPTMGALHEGHLSLIRRAVKETDRVVVSIFVNPIQFDRKTDLRSYPRPLKEDARLAAEAGADLLFVPSARAIYPPDFQTFVEVKKLSRPWEGRFRPGHFLGVTTVVAKLFHLVQPEVAYFGRKDAQQHRIVGQMIRDLNFDIRLKVMPTVREPEGLAMSSRNRLLSSDARRSSRALFHTLHEGRRLIQSGERRGSVVVRRMEGWIRRAAPGAKVDYAAAVDPQTLEPVSRIRKRVWLLLAVRIGGVRLIDEMEVRADRG